MGIIFGDPWYAFLDWQDRLVFGEVLKVKPGHDELESARVIAIQLYSIQSVTDVVKLFDKLRVDAAEAATPASPRQSTSGIPERRYGVYQVAGFPSNTAGEHDHVEFTRSSLDFVFCRGSYSFSGS